MAMGRPVNKSKVAETIVAIFQGGLHRSVRRNASLCWMASIAFRQASNIVALV